MKNTCCSILLSKGVCLQQKYCSVRSRVQIAFSNILKSLRPSVARLLRVFSVDTVIQIVYYKAFRCHNTTLIVSDFLNFAMLKSGKDFRYHRVDSGGGKRPGGGAVTQNYNFSIADDDESDSELVFLSLRPTRGRTDIFFKKQPSLLLNGQVVWQASDSSLLKQKDKAL